MKRLMLVGLFVLLNPGIDLPRIGNCRTLPMQASCLTGVRYSSGVTQRMWIWPDWTVQAQEKESGGLSIGSLDDGQVRFYMGSITHELLRIEPTERIVFTDTAPPNTVVCWKQTCRRLEELFASGSVPYPLWNNPLTIPLVQDSPAISGGSK